MLFDTLITDLNVPLKTKLDNLPQDELEVHFLANQIPLLGVGRVSGAPRIPPILALKPKFVAYSEVNDILTDELAPYFEHLYYSRCMGGLEGDDSRDVCLERDFNRRSESMTRSDRKHFAKHLGFDVVDVRAKFAPWYPIVSLTDPGTAHTDHIRASKNLRSLLFCGYDGNQSRLATNGCDAKP